MSRFEALLDAARKRAQPIAITPDRNPSER